MLLRGGRPLRSFGAVRVPALVCGDHIDRLETRCDGLPRLRNRQIILSVGSAFELRRRRHAHIVAGGRELVGSTGAFAFRPAAP
jgi:hypothetical protein